MSIKTKTYRSFESNRRQIYGGLIIFVLTLVTILPLLATFGLSVFAEGTTLIGQFSVANWSELFNNIDVVWRTFLYAFGAATVTTILAVFTAWAIARTNMPFSRFFYYLVFGMLFLPPIVWESVWIQLMASNGFYASFLPFDFQIYSIPGMILVQSVFMFPLAMIVLMPVFENVDNALEEASRISGAGILQTTRRITIPVIRPGILAAFLLVLVLSLGTLRVPLLIGQPGGIMVLPSAIYNNVATSPVDYGMAFVQSSMLILLALPVFYLYKRMLGKTSRYETVSGAAKRASLQLGRFSRYVLAGITAFILLTLAIIPFLVMVHGSLSPYLVPFQRVFSLNVPITLEQYTALLSDASLHSAALNSFFAAGISTLLAVLGAIFISWVVYKSDIAYKGIIDYVSFLPIAITSTSLAVGFIAIYLGILPIGIYGTIWIVMLAYLTRSLPTTTRVTAPSIQQLNNEVLEAAVISGANKLRRIRTVLLPLVMPTVHAVGAWRFAILYKEFPMSILLAPAGMELIAPYIFELGVQANFPRISAIGVALTVFLAVVTILIHQIPAYGNSS